MKRSLRALLLVTLLPPACAPVARGADGGPITRGEMRDGKRHGPWTIFLPGGARTATGTFDHDVPNGPWKAFHADGALRERVVFVRGVRDGPAATFHGNGQPESRGRYAGGLREGPWLWFLADGTLDAARTGCYRADVRIE